MAHPPRLDGRTVALTLLVGGIGLCFVGGGPVNGDQAVYLYQAANHLWFERWTHAAYVGLLGLLGANGAAADVLNVAFGCGAVALIGRRVGWRGAALTAGSILPWLPWGEVDLAWFFLLVAAMEFAPLGALAVWFSPTTLAAVPWLWTVRRRAAWVMVLAALCVALASGGHWISGNRGVLVLHWSPAPLTQLAWLWLPLVLSVRGLGSGDRWTALALAPLLLAPGDVPAFLCALPLLARHVQAPLWALALHLFVGAAGLGMRIQEVEEERQLIAAAAMVVRPGDGVDASWSVAVRLSLELEGRPDALRRPNDSDYCSVERRWRLVSGKLPRRTDCR